MDKFQQSIIKELEKATGQKDISLEVPPNQKLGDYAFPCFSLAKVFKKAPNDIAQDLAKKIETGKTIERIEVKGPYLNFFIAKESFVGQTLKKIAEEKEKYGCSGIGKGKKALVEHTSINPNASPHVGRARNAMIGDSIVRILKFQGYNVETRYWVNDIGKQIAMLVLGCKGKKSIKFKDLLDIYVEINEKADKDESVEKEVFAILKKLEDNDKEIIAEFKRVVDICVKGQTELLAELGIKYDKFDYESDYLFSKKTDDVLKLLEKTGKLFTDEEGRKVLNQEGFELAMKSPVLVLTRADGTSLYPLRDLAYTIDKHAAGENVLVLGEDQKLYFQQIRAALSTIKKPAPNVVHYSFVLLQEGKMSTRKGNLVLLEDFMKEAFEKAKKEIQKRHGKADEKNAKKIAYGAIKYAILKVSAEKNVIFTWEQALSFEGDSGPYLQYAYARICSILKKNKDKIDDRIDYSLLKEPQEQELVKMLGNFPEVIKNAAEQLKPHLIATYIYNLSSSFSMFYNACPVLKADDEIKKARLLLINSVKQVLETGLNLLGIEVLEKM